MDGITSAALVLAHHPDAQVSFVTNAHAATQILRRDLSSRRFIAIDLGLTPDFAKNLNRKTKQAHAVLLDHHAQTLAHIDHLDTAVERLVIPGMSAAAVTRAWLQESGLTHLAAIADVVEYCRSPALDTCERDHGEDRIDYEGRMLDFAWRWKVGDDRFRLQTARRLAQGMWPSDIPEVHRRYLAILNERRWERALDRVRGHVKIQGEIALLRFGRRKPSLLGFGSRALTAVAQEEGCRVALLVHRRDDVTSISARILTAPYKTGRRPRREIDLGRFIDEFTQQYGGAGGGHPESAGGKIPTRHLPQFLRELECFA